MFNACYSIRMELLLVLVMELTFSRMVFILEGNADHDGKMVGVCPFKIWQEQNMARTRCNAKRRGRPCKDYKGAKTRRVKIFYV